MEPRLMPRKSLSGKGSTTPRNYRLAEDTLADLDLIAAKLTERDGVPRTRSDAIRFAAKEAAKKFKPAKPKS